MPNLSVQLIGNDPNGQPIQPAVMLAGRGPVVQATVGLSQAMAAALAQQGKPVPPPAAGFALIDTGATTTCVDDVIAQGLGLPVIDTVTMHSASHASHQANVYPILLSIAGLPMGIDAPRAMGAALQSQGLIALIGRDLLQHCILVYNGITGSFSLSI